MLRVSLTPWRKRFAVIAGFPLSGPPPGKPVVEGCCYGFFGWTPFGWTPRLSLLKGKANFHSLRPFSLHNDILYERQVLKAIQLPNAPACSDDFYFCCF